MAKSSMTKSANNSVKINKRVLRRHLLVNYVFAVPAGNVTRGATAGTAVVFRSIVDV